MTDERTELRRKREECDVELAELGDALEAMQARTDALDDGIAAAIEVRDTATEAFLPDDRLPDSVTTETRGVVESYLDTLGEVRDEQSEKLEMREDDLKVETKNATDARDDIDEIETVIARLEEWIDEAESTVTDAREELDGAQSQFGDDLAALAARFEPLDVDLLREPLGIVIDERLPERKSEMQASVESARERVVTLSARKSKLATERDTLESIDGGGSCPTCNQNVGPDRNETEVNAIEEELHEVERRLDDAKQERDELIAGIEELETLRGKAIRLRTFRSETVEAAAGRLEDHEANLADLRADYREERSGLAASKAERERADAAIERITIECAGFEADIDRLQAKIAKGETCLEAFEVVDELRAQLQGRVEELSDLQETYEEKERECAALDEDLENLTDD